MYGQAAMDIGEKKNSSSSSSSEENGDGNHDRHKMSDTVIVMNLIQQAVDQEVDNGTGNDDGLSRCHHERICSVMGKIHGEYSFLLYCPSSSSGILSSGFGGTGFHQKWHV
jgi:hypothetical protein